MATERSSEVDVEEIRIDLGERSYPVRVGPGLLEGAGDACCAAGLSGRALLVSDETVGGLYGGVVLRSLREAGYDVHYALIPAGEEQKNLETLSLLYDACVDAKLDRGSFIVALGGGVIGDVGGFAAATYMRGIPFVQAPTTLLAQVDASVGGKTAVNHRAAKNLIGSFHQPRLVLADPTTLVSLPRREYVSGLAEVVKHGLIADRDLFDYCERERKGLMRLERRPLQHVIVRSIEIKAGVVQADEREGGLRAILNFGHTVGHAIEQAAKYGTYTHGEAVAIGMVVEGRLSMDRGLLSAPEWEGMRSLLAGLGLPIRAGGIDFERLVPAMMKDKKTTGGKLRFALLDGIGKAAVVSDLSPDEVRAAWEATQQTGPDSTPGFGTE